MKKFGLNSFLLSLSISLMLASNLPYSFNILASASYDPEKTGDIEYSDDGSILLQSISPIVNVNNDSKSDEINEKKSTVDADVPKDKEQNENFNDVSKSDEINEEESIDDANVPTVEEQTLLPYEAPMPQNNEPFVPTVEDVNDEHFSEDSQSEGFNDNQVNEDNNMDENNLPIVINDFQLENGSNEIPDTHLLPPAPRRALEEDYKEKTCGCLSVLFKKFWG